MQKKFLVILAFLVSTVTSSRCFSKVSTAVDINYTPRYMAGVVGNVLSDTPVATANVFAGVDSGLYADFFGVMQTSDQSHLLEGDLGLGWSGPIKGLGIDFSPSAYIIAFDGLGSPFIWVTFKLSKTLDSFTIFGSFDRFYLMPATAYGWDEQSAFTVGGTFSHSIMNPNTMFNSSLSEVYDNGGFGSFSGFMSKGMASINWKSSDSVSFTIPKLEAYVPNTMYDTRKAQLVLTFGMTVGF